MAVDHKIACFSRYHITKDCHSVESSVVSASPAFFVISLAGLVNRSLLRLLLHMHPEEIICTVLTLKINIGLFLPKALTPTRHRS